MAIFSIFRSTVIVVCEGVRELSSFLPTSVPGTDRTTGLSASDTINSTSYSLVLTIVVHFRHFHHVPWPGGHSGGEGGGAGAQVDAGEAGPGWLRVLHQRRSGAPAGHLRQ